MWLKLFPQIPSEELCFAFSIVLENQVTNQEPALAKVFDYYESSKFLLLQKALSLT